MTTIRGTFLLQQHIQANGPAFPGKIKHSVSFVPLPSMCLTYAEEQLAPTAVVHPGEYLKIMCEHR